MLWPYVMSVIIYYLYELDEVWNSAFLLLFMVSQLVDVGIFLTEGRMIEPTCAFVGSKMLGKILLPSLGLSQHILQALFPPTRNRIALSSYRFLTVATHMIVLLCALHSTECGQENNESFQALAYASILVYIFSLPVKVGGVYFIILVSSFIVLWILQTILYSHTSPRTATAAQIIRSEGSYCYLYAAVFLCEPHFSRWVDFILSNGSSYQFQGDEDSRSSNGSPITICNENPSLVQNEPPSFSPGRHYPSICLPPIQIDADQLKNLVAEQRQFQLQLQLEEKISSQKLEFNDPSSLRSPNGNSSQCKYPVKTGKKLLS